MAAGIAQLAQAMAAQGAARLEQAGRTHEAQEAANRAEDARVAALNQRVTQLQAQVEQVRQQADVRVAGLEQTVAAQAELIRALTTRLGALEVAHRGHTHEYTALIQTRPGSPRVIMGRLTPTPTRTSPPQ